MDITKHNPEMPHGVNKETKDNFFRHTKQWYSIWGDKCPICGVEAQFKLTKQETTSA